jgi:hypothetical protein
MPNPAVAYMQFLLAAPQKCPRCPRRICRRENRCVPPPDRAKAGLHRCRFESRSEWDARFPVAWQKYEEVLREFPDFWARIEAAGKEADQPSRKASAGGLRSGRGGSPPR